MDRGDFQRLAEDRLLDAANLLAGSRWSAAYYMAGYAVECGLKSCVLAYIIATEGVVIFDDKGFSGKCWTHNIEELVKLANLAMAREVDIGNNPDLGINWIIAKDWSEKSRYEQKTKAQAQGLYDAIADNANGVMQWIRGRW